MVSGAGVAAYVADGLGHTFSERAVALDGEESIPPDIGAIKGGVNMLLVGSDVCEDDFKAEFGDRCSDLRRAGSATTRTCCCTSRTALAA